MAAAILVGSFASVATAARVDLEVYENQSGADVSGLDLWVDVLAAGADVDFVFHNDSSISSIITQIYFEDGLDALIANGSIFNESAGVDFKIGATPSDPPGGNTIGWMGTYFSVGRENPVSNGINPGETLTLRFDLVGGATVDAIVAALGTTGTRIAEHIQSLPTGASVAAVTVPVPVAVGPGLVLLAGLGLYRYRRSRTWA